MVQKVDRLVDRMEGLTEGHLVDRMEGHSADRMAALKVGQMEGHSAVQMAVQMAVETVDCSVDLKVAPRGGRMEAHLAALQGLLEVRAALHPFAQLAPVLVEGRQPVLQALVVLGLEVVFA